MSRRRAGGTGWVAQGPCVQREQAGRQRAKLPVMRTPACVAACLLFLVSLGAPAQPAKFTGTWEAAHEGKIFLVLKIQAGQKISGTLNAGSIKLSDDGELIEASRSEEHTSELQSVRH